MSRHISETHERSTAWLFSAALAIQLGHELEHFIQVVQAKVNHQGPPHGLFGSVFDTEWVHLGYNTVLFVVLATVVARKRSALREVGAVGPATRLFLAGVVFQGYHVVEHTVKIVQHVSSGVTPAPGIVGHHVDLIWLHFTYNLGVTASMVAGFVGLKILRDLKPLGAGVRLAG